jgi:hypothetical protein
VPPRLLPTITCASIESRRRRSGCCSSSLTRRPRRRWGGRSVGQKIMPWRVEDALTARGANYVQSGLFKAFVVRDGRLITGQQQSRAARSPRPWSRRWGSEDGSRSSAPATSAARSARGGLRHPSGSDQRTPDQAVVDAEVIVLAVPGSAAKDVVGSLGEALEGKVVLDAAKCCLWRQSERSRAGGSRGVSAYSGAARLALGGGGPPGGGCKRADTPNTDAQLRSRWAGASFEALGLRLAAATRSSRTAPGWSTSTPPPSSTTTIPACWRPGW